MTAEDRILLACTRQDFLPRHRTTVLELAGRGPVCWDRVSRMAEQHGVAPLVGANLSRCGTDLRVPTRVLDRFHRARCANIVRKQLAAERTAQALAWFNERSIGVMLLKGAALDLLVYDQPWLTQSADVDLVLRCRRNTAAFEQTEHMALALEAQRVEVNYFEHHDVTMNGALPVDFELIWQEARPIEFRGQRAFVMRPEDLLLAACINACRKRFFRLKFLLDVAECSRRLHDLDWRSFTRRARAFQCGSIALAALLAARATLESEVPLHVLDALGVHPARKRLLCWLVHQLVHRASLARLSPFSGVLWRGKRIGISLLLPYASYPWSCAWRSLSRSCDPNPDPEKVAVRVRGRSAT